MARSRERQKKGCTARDFRTRFGSNSLDFPRLSGGMNCVFTVANVMRIPKMKIRNGISCSFIGAATVFTAATVSGGQSSSMVAAGFPLSAVFTGESATLLVLGVGLFLAGRFLRRPGTRSQEAHVNGSTRPVDLLRDAASGRAGTMVLAD